MIKRKWNIFMSYSHWIHNFLDLKFFFLWPPRAANTLFLVVLNIYPTKVTLKQCGWCACIRRLQSQSQWTWLLEICSQVWFCSHFEIRAFFAIQRCLLSLRQKKNLCWPGSISTKACAGAFLQLWARILHKAIQYVTSGMHTIWCSLFKKQCWAHMR